MSGPVGDDGGVEKGTGGAECDTGGPSTMVGGPLTIAGGPLGTPGCSANDAGLGPPLVGYTVNSSPTIEESSRGWPGFAASSVISVPLALNEFTACFINRHREPNTGRIILHDFGGRDADYITGRINDRSAGVSGIEFQIELDDSDVRCGL